MPRRPHRELWNDGDNVSITDSNTAIASILNCSCAVFAGAIAHFGHADLRRQHQHDVLTPSV